MKGLKVVVLLLSVVMLGSCTSRGQLKGQNFGNGNQKWMQRIKTQDNGKGTVFQNRNHKCDAYKR